jgi:two-component system response regulator HydG
MTENKKQTEQTPLAILVIDDDTSHADVVAAALERISEDRTIAVSQAAAIEILRTRYFDVVITDLAMEQQQSGIEILQAVKQLSEETEVIVMTAHNSVEFAVEAMRQGAFNYLQKPLDLKQLRTIVEKAGASSQLKRINRELTQRLDEKFGFTGVVGSSPAMLAVIERVKRIAPTDATVLIQGETGTGKELFAQAIHQNSPRKNKHFVALNCGALTESILESELFGHIKGAFTDASSDRVGKFEYATGGTVFLDEVGDMPMATQIKLLRVLENGEVTRVGSNESVKVNVRLLSATNRNLEEAVEAGTFRRDLYHRLKVVTIRIPPLRERTDDIPVLLDHFIKMFTKRHSKTIKGVTSAARRVLFAYDWPGNVRQLRNIVESMVVVDFDELIDVDDLPEELDGIKPPQQTAEAINGGVECLIGKTLEEVENMLIQVTLKTTGGNREEAAKILGIGERTLYRKIKSP